MNGNFVQLKYGFIRNVKIRHIEKSVYLCIKAYAYDGTCFPSVKRIAHDAGVCVRTVQRCVKALAEKGLITVTARKSENGGNMTNLYTINYENEEKNSVSSESTKNTPVQSASSGKTGYGLKDYSFVSGSCTEINQKGIPAPFNKTEDSADYNFYGLSEKSRRIMRRIMRLGADMSGGVNYT